VTERLARACSAHPWRTIGAWLLAVVAAVAALALLLGELTTNGHPTNNPESQRAESAIGRAFPPQRQNAVSDIVVVRSDRYTVESPAFRTFVQLAREAGARDSPIAKFRATLREAKTPSVARSSATNATPARR
jgi:hypothetical protein